MGSRDGALLFGLMLDRMSMDGVLGVCEESLRTRQRTMIGVVNAAKVVNSRRDPELLESLLESDVLLADGQSVVWASRLLRDPLPVRVTGIDLFQQLMAMAAERNARVYFLGATPEVLDRLIERVGHDYPGLRIAGSRDGYFADEEAESVAADIRNSDADMLFIGMVSPRKEIFLRRWGPTLNVPVLHGVGGSFDVLAGVTKRAPEAWQRAGMEWAYRLRQEPRRLWRRYLTTNSAFVALTIREMARKSPEYVMAVPAAVVELPVDVDLDLRETSIVLPGPRTSADDGIPSSAEV